MNFELKLTDVPSPSGVIARVTGGHLRSFNAEAGRIIAASAGRPDDEVTAAIMDVARQRGLDFVDPDEVRKEVIRARTTAR